MCHALYVIIIFHNKSTVFNGRQVISSPNKFTQKQIKTKHRHIFSNE